MLIIIGGIATLLWDVWLQQKIGKLWAKWKRRSTNTGRAEESATAGSVTINERLREGTAEGLQRRVPATILHSRGSDERTDAGPSNSMPLQQDAAVDHARATPVTDTSTHGIPVKTGAVIIGAFLVSFIVIMAIRGTLSARALVFDLFANMYLAGTIIFGGGPVVIPLLREYVVQPGWVSPRDFLIGLAIIQAFPGPNFNFSVYLGALTLAPTKIPTIFGALLGYIGIFLPGLTLAVGVQSLWRVLRTKPWVVSLLKGINATAVGLVFTAVYRLWEIGYLTPESSDGKSLAGEPWWVVVAAVTYAESAWFGVPPALAIIIGASLGLGWYAVAR